MGKARSEKNINLLTYYPIVDENEKIPTPSELTLEQIESQETLVDSPLWEITTNSINNIYEVGLSIFVYWLYRHQDALERRFFRLAQPELPIVHENEN